MKEPTSVRSGSEQKQSLTEQKKGNGRSYRKETTVRKQTDNTNSSVFKDKEPQKH